MPKSGPRPSSPQKAVYPAFLYHLSTGEGPCLRKLAKAEEAQTQKSPAPDSFRSRTIQMKEKCYCPPALSEKGEELEEAVFLNAMKVRGNRGGRPDSGGGHVPGNGLEHAGSRDPGGHCGHCAASLPDPAGQGDSVSLQPAYGPGLRSFRKCRVTVPSRASRGPE